LDGRNHQNFYTTLTYYKNDPSAAAIGVFTTQGNKYHRIRTLTDFEGKVLRKQTEQLWVPDIGRLATDETFDYTPQGRLERHNHSVEGPYGNNNTELAFMRYDPLGKQIGKRWDGGLEDIGYTYNIRGWLKEINSRAFKFELFYNQPANGIPLYNGNIAQTRWWSVRDNRWRSYTYRYDALNRLLEANYHNESRGISGSYDVSLEYDKQGNIQHLTRYGLQENPTNNVMIDNLRYFYDPANPNRLLKVTDLTNSHAGFRDDGNGTLAGDPDDDYEYDQDGNMTADQNKEISYIAYNHANMPTHVNMRRGYIEFIYDALGNKWYKFSKDGAAEEAKGTAYIFGMQYEFKYNDYIKYDWKLMFIGTDEGYVSAVYPEGIDNEFKFQYVYNHTDHLGNIRQNITRENGNLTVLREHNYYPFGLLHGGYNENEQDLIYDKEQDFIFTVQAQAGRYKYRYNGKEWQDDLGLNWYDYGARSYDAAVGRWFVVDPILNVQIEEEIKVLLKRNQYKLTPYHYSRNTPIWYKDSNGKIEHPVKGVSSGKVRISSRFGIRRDPINPSRMQGHGGVDYAVPIGTKVYAVADGVIVRAGYSKSYGYVVVIKHKNGAYSLYAHNSKLKVKVGQKVNEGEIISLSGNTGSRTTGPHLHFEIIKSDKELKMTSPKDPNSIYNKKNKVDPNGKNLGNYSNEVFDALPDEETDKINAEKGINIESIINKNKKDNNNEDKNNSK